MCRLQCTSNEYECRSSLRSDRDPRHPIRGYGHAAVLVIVSLESRDLLMITFVQTPQTVNTALTQHIPELYVSGVGIAPARHPSIQ